MTVTLDGVPVLGFLLASVRIVAWLAVVPPFASRAVPALAKVSLSLGLAFAATPSLTGATVPSDTPGLLLSVLTQALIGAAMGFVTYLLFAAVSAAGSLIDVFGGFSLSQAYDPLGLNMNSVFGTFHQMIGSMLLFVSGGYLLVIGGLLKTFTLLPIGSLPDVDGGPVLLTAVFRTFFVVAVEVALPLVSVLFIADLGLALLTKVAPQLNAINLMFPAKIGLTLLLVGLSFPLLPGVSAHLAEMALQAMSRLADTAGSVGR